MHVERITLQADVLKLLYEHRLSSPLRFDFIQTVLFAPIAVRLSSGYRCWFSNIFCR
jgi:hypothetical protein